MIRTPQFIEQVVKIKLGDFDVRLWIKGDPITASMVVAAIRHDVPVYKAKERLVAFLPAVSVENGIAFSRQEELARFIGVSQAEYVSAVEVTHDGEGVVAYMEWP